MGHYLGRQIRLDAVKLFLFSNAYRWLQMMIVFNEAGLRDVKPPCVAQTFINHNAVLYKVFVIGQQHYIVERPSIKNFSAGGTSVFNPFSAGTVVIRQNLTSVDVRF